MIKITRKPLLALGAAVVSALIGPLCTTPAFAGPASQPGKRAVEEVVVTATYRDTRLMDTPIAITAVTDKEIQAKGIEDIRTLYQSIPGLNYGSNSSTYNTISVRGLTPPAGGQAVVGIYMDNTPMTDSNSGGISQGLGTLFDIERVEVLRGPQGTLYGEGNMGGSIRYITKKPDTTGTDYKLRTQTESIRQSDGLSYKVEGMLNVPLVADQLALRVVGYRKDQKGYFDTPRPRDESDINWEEENGVRAKLSWFATEDIEFALTGNYLKSEFGGPGLAFYCYTQSTPSTPNGQVPVYNVQDVCAGKYDRIERGNPYFTDLAHPEFESGGFDEQFVYNFSVEWELPFAHFTSSTSYYDKETNYAEETSPRFSIGLINLVNTTFGFGPNGLATLGGDGSFARFSERFVQEFRLVSPGDGAFRWTVGAYYKDDDSTNGQHKRCHKGGSPVYDTLQTHCSLQLGFFPTTPLATQQAIVNLTNTLLAPGNNSYLTFQEKSVYGEVSYAFTDQWDLTAGLRYAATSFDLDIGRPGVDSKANPLQSLGTSDRLLSPKATLAWRPDDNWMVYATFSEGFRPGVLNSGLTTRIAQLQPLVATNPRAAEEFNALANRRETAGDKVFNYEIGAKATILDGRMSFTSSLYFFDWQDTLILVSHSINDIPGVSTGNFTYTINGGKAESRGAELEIRYALTDAMQVNFGTSYNWKAEIGSGGSGPYGGVSVEAGNRLAQAPKHTFNLSYVWDFPLGDWSGNFRADGFYISNKYFTANNEEPAPGYETVDVKFSARRDAWDLSLYVRNLFDETITLDLNPVGYRLGKPRTIGAEVTYTPGG